MPRKLTVITNIPYNGHWTVSWGKSFVARFLKDSGADFFAQLPGHSTVLPLNAVTALIGSPVIIWFIVKRQKIQRSFVLWHAKSDT